MIYFRTIRYKNFLSTGNYFTEINLSGYKSTLIVGKNGSGKSTVLDALCYALFNKPFRDINKPQMPNSINQKDMMVELEFAIGRNEYKIERGMKPNVFNIYCNGTLLNQDAKTADYQEYLEKTILKINFKSFTQIVILGAASYTPFMKLTASERRMIIEDLLDIQVFSSMHSIAKVRLTEIKDQINSIKYEIETLERTIDMQKKHIESLETNTEEKKSIFAEANEKDEEQIHQLNDKILELKRELDELDLPPEEKSVLDSKSKKLLSYEAQIENNVRKFVKSKTFYAENSSCPTCKQEIDSDFRDDKIRNLEEKLSKSHEALGEIEVKIVEVSDKIKSFETFASRRIEITNTIQHYQMNISDLERNIQSRWDEILSLSNPQEKVVDQRKELKKMNQSLKDTRERNKTLIESRAYYEAATSMLKDSGIKTKIVKQYLPIINTLINKYLSAMDFFVNFNLDESFKETIKSRHRDEFSYQSFSEGQKKRIDMALMLTWRAVAKIKSSVHTNLLILDEVFDSSLDNDGVDALMIMLQELEKTNLFVISQRSDQLIEKFDSSIKFVMYKDFSKIEE